MDALPPDTLPATAFVAATDLHPRSARERELCEKASHPDWLYLTGLLALDVGAIALHPTLKQSDTQAVRLLGPSLIGFTWGATLGGGALSRPTCDPNWVRMSPPEGDARASWPLTIALALAASASAPLIAGIVTGPLSAQWDYTERSSRLWLTAGAAAVGSLVPRIPWIAPTPHRAAIELERLHLEPVKGGAVGGVAVRF